MFEVEFEGNWTRVSVTGSPNTAAMLRGISRAPQTLEGNLLVDVRTVAVASGTDHALLGSELATRFPRLRRIALVVDENVLTYNSERAARREGAHLRVFTELDDAQRWLVS